MIKKSHFQSSKLLIPLNHSENISEINTPDIFKNKESSKKLIDHWKQRNEHEKKKPKNDWFMTFVKQLDDKLQ